MSNQLLHRIQTADIEINFSKIFKESKKISKMTIHEGQTQNSQMMFSPSVIVLFQYWRQKEIFFVSPPHISRQNEIS